MMEKMIDNLLTRGMVEYRHHSIEVLRIFLGALLFYKGYYFVENIPEIYVMIEERIQISPFIIAHYVVAAHLVGGIMLTIGLITRVAVVVQIPILIGAVFVVHAREIFLVTATELEYSILVLVLLIVFFFYGGGKWSVDHHIIRRKAESASQS